ncbi:unnamed protein product, partial [Closterium sp. NIES-54]
MVTTTTPGGQRVSICTCIRTGRHLATFTRPVAPLCSCRLLSHHTLLWHHRLGHPSLPRLCGMHSRLLVFGLSRSLPPLPPSPAPPCLPCVEGRQRAVPHSSSFSPMTAPMQTLHMDVWGPARISGQGRKRYFVLVVDDCTHYTTVFPLSSKGEVPDVLIPRIRAVRLHLRERFREDLPVLRLHSDRGGEFFSNLLRDFCRGEGILQSFTLPASPQQNGIAERRIGLVMEYAAYQLNLWPHVSLPETSLTLRWMGEVGDASVFQVWGSRAFVDDTSAEKLSACAIPYVFLGFSPDAPGWQFYHPTSRRVLSSQDVTFDESVPFYRLFPYRSAPPPPPPLFLALGPPSVDPLPPQGASQGAASRGAASGGAEPGGAESEGAGSEGAEPGGEEPVGVVPAGMEPGGAELEGVVPGVVELEGVEPGGAEPEVWGLGVLSLRVRRLGSLSPQQQCKWSAQGTHLWSGAARAGDSAARDTGARGVGATCLGGAGVCGTGGVVAAGPGGVRTRGAGAGGARGGDRAEPGGAGAGGAVAGGTSASGAGAGGTGASGAGAGGARAGDTGPIDPGAGGAGAGGALSGGTSVGGTVRRRPLSFSPALPERREPDSRPTLPVHTVRTGRRFPRPRPPPVPGTHAMALRPSSVPLRVPLPPPPESSLPSVPDPESDLARAASPTVPRLLATAVTDLSFESTAASALVVELVDFTAACRLDYASGLVAQSESASPPSVGGECALGTDILEDKQEEFECLATAVPHLVAILLALEGDSDAPNIPTPRSYTEAITGPYSSQWQTAMDAEMASLKSIGTYVNAVPPSGAKIVDGMWIFRVKWPLGSPPTFKTRYVARGF